MADYSIYVLEHFAVLSYHVSRIIYGGSDCVHRKLTFSYALIKRKGHTALVQVGYNHKDYGKHLDDKFGIENWQSLKDVLAEVSVELNEVDTIFVIHTYFDHFGNVEDFSNTTFYIQECELAKWVLAMSLPERMRFMMIAVDPGDIPRCVDLARQGHLVTVVGDFQNVMPGVDLHVVYDSYTFASMWATVNNDGAADSMDAWVPAGDLIYVCENIEGNGNAANVRAICTPAGLATGSQANFVLPTEWIMS